MSSECPALLTWQRHEAKFLITEDQALDVRRYCKTHVAADVHAGGAHSDRYPIRSIYLDSPTRALLRSTLERRNDRFKLRIRTYRHYDQPMGDAPVFLEIKRKTNGLIRKTRARVPASQTGDVLWEQCAPPMCPDLERTPNAQNLAQFLELRKRMLAEPVVGVYYNREAYESQSGDRVRVTMDRDLYFGRLAPLGSPDCEAWWPATRDRMVVLEIKFTNTYPLWVADMLHRVEVCRRGVCKYAICARSV